MKNRAKLILIACILTATTGNSQVNLAPPGIFSFVDTLAIDSNLVISPGQLSRDGKTYFLGLSNANEEFDGTVKSDLYRIPLGNTIALPLHLPNPDSIFQFYQCSASADNRYLAFVINESGTWDDNNLAMGLWSEAEQRYDSFRVLEELNDTAQSDAYPWLSDDALRLYFTREFRLMYSERKSTSDNFSEAKQVDFEGEVQLDIISSWLTPDELTMYMLADNRIYKTTRKNRSAEFEFPVLFTDQFKDLYFLAGHSFLPDRKTMYIYYYDGVNDFILEYKLLKGRI